MSWPTTAVGSRAAAPVVVMVSLLLSFSLFGSLPFLFDFCCGTFVEFVIVGLLFGDWDCDYLNCCS